MPWTCLLCRRSFAREGQSHSCRPSVSLEGHFEGKSPALRAAFAKIVQGLEKEGPLRVDPVAANIHLAAGSTFASAKPMKAKLRVKFLLDRPVESPRVVKAERFSATRHTIHVDVGDAADVDAELMGWLRLWT
jgi:hypothetical protein